MFLISCQKENVEESGIITSELETQVTSVNPLVTRIKKTKTNTSLDLGCFEIIYPFSMIIEDGSVVTINSFEDIEVLEDNSDNIIVDFNFPITIILSSGEETIINNNEELSELFAGCVLLDEWTDELPAYNVSYDNPCFNLSYPLTLYDIDLNEVVVTSDEEFNAYISSDLYFFEFPISLVDQNEALIEVTSDDDLIGTLLSCHELTHTDSLYSGIIGEVLILFDCFNLDFPLSYNTITGSTIVANSQIEFEESIFRGEFESFIFPIVIVDEENVKTTVNSSAEFESIFTSCVGFNFEIDLLTILLQSNQEQFADVSCYDLIFPLSGYGELNDDIITVNNLSELRAIEDFYRVIYPFDIYVTNDDTAVTIENAESYLTIIDNCQ